MLFFNSEKETFLIKFSGERKINRNELSLNVTLSKLFLFYLEEDKYLQELLATKVNLENALCCHSFIEIFKLQVQTAFSCVERYFTTLSATKNSLQLEFTCLVKTLKSSGLLVTSEREVHDAADAWLGCDVGSRKKYARQLLSTGRLPLLSEEVLKLL